MDSWKLTGNEKGTAVLSLDPDEGPFSPFEFQAIITRTNEYLAENKISYYEAALIRVFCATGRRPIQIAGLKVKDLYVTSKYKFEDKKKVHVLNIPKAKIRGASGFRYAFREVGIRESIVQILFEHTRILKQKLRRTCKIIVPADTAVAPLKKEAFFLIKPELRYDFRDQSSCFSIS